LYNIAQSGSPGPLADQDWASNTGFRVPMPEHWCGRSSEIVYWVDSALISPFGYYERMIFSADNYTILLIKSQNDISYTPSYMAHMAPPDYPFPTIHFVQGQV
jgi:hypothetical protein